MAYFDDDDDDVSSIGRRLLAGVRDDEGPDETGQAPPTPPPLRERKTLGEFQGQVQQPSGGTPPLISRPDDDVGFKPRPGLVESTDAAVRYAREHANDSGDQNGATPRRMQQPTSMVTPQPTLIARNGGAAPAASPASPAPAAGTTTAPPPSVTAPPGIARRGPMDYGRINAQPPSMVSALPPAPAAPEADPRRAAAMDTIAQNSAPTPKTDASGNTLPQYKMGLGRRILMGAAATLGHGLPGLAEVTTNPNDPNYIGPGATNATYARTEARRKATLEGATGEQGALDKEAALQERDFQNKTTQYRDEARTAAQADVLAERQAKDEAMAKDKADLEQIRAAYQKLREDAEKYKEDNANVTYDAASRQFMQNGHQFTPKSVEQGAVLEARERIDGPYTKLWKQERRNNITVGDRGAKWSKENEAKIKSWGREHNLSGTSADEIAAQMSSQDLQQALGHAAVGGETFINSSERSEYNRRTAGIQKQIDKYQEDVRGFQEGLGSPNLPPDQKAQMQGMADRAQSQIDNLEKQKKAVEDEIVGRRPKPQGAGTPAPTAQPPRTAAPQAAPQGGQPPEGNKAGYKKPNGKFYQYGYVNRQTGQKIGSDDGKTWYDIKSGQPINTGAQKKTP